MRKLLFGLSLLALLSCGSKKKDETGNKETGNKETAANGTSLEQRLGEYMKLNEALNLDKLMDYVYPQVFTIAPRESMLEAMKSAFQSDEMKISIENMKADKIHPSFEMEGGDYAKVLYSMDMTMKGNNPEEGWNEAMISNMEQAYGKENVSLDEASGALRIHQQAEMVAIKDKHSPEWTFVSLKAEDPIVQKLFSKELLDKLATYK